MRKSRLDTQKVMGEIQFYRKEGLAEDSINIIKPTLVLKSLLNWRYQI